MRLVDDAPPGFEHYGDELLLKIAEYGLEHVVSVGASLPAAMPSVMASLDIVVAPWVTESFSFSLLEAMAMECAVVATAVGGTPELVTDGVSGVLVPLDDPSALRGAIERLINNPAWRAQLGRAARQRVLTEFSVDAMTSATMAVQHDVVECHRAHGDGPQARHALRERLADRAARMASSTDPLY